MATKTATKSTALSDILTEGAVSGRDVGAANTANTAGTANTASVPAADADTSRRQFARKSAGDTFSATFAEPVSETSTGETTVDEATPEETIAEVIKRIRMKAMDALARRDYARVELQRRLLQYCADVDIVESIVQDLVDSGLQSDARFAQSFIRYRAGRGYGPARIRQELVQRGTEPAQIALAFEICEIDWQQRAAEVRNKKFGAATPADYKAQARQMSFLNYRGFETDQISALYSDH